VSLIVKRLEQRVRFVDQLLDAVGGRILTAAGRDETQRSVRKSGAQSGHTYSEANPKKYSREMALFAFLGAVGLWRLVR
jgi:hypothetical protein